jgi:mTERF domain-containing protein
MSLSKLVRKLPQVLGLSIEDNLEPKLVWLQERLQLDSKSLSKLVRGLPAVLGYNVKDNLEPTIQFYVDCVGSNAAIPTIAKYPSLLGYSLENRLQPRLAQVQEAGIPLDTGTISRMATFAEERWSISLAFQKTKLLKQQLKDR